MARRKQGWESAPGGGQPFHSPFAGLANRTLAAGGRTPPPTAAPAPAREAASPAPPEWATMSLQLRRERRGRAGRTVTLVAGFGCRADAQAAAQLLARALGCGAQVEGQEVLLQGDQGERAAHLLGRQGVPRVVGGG